jgi:hypothetical protein
MARGLKRMGIGAILCVTALVQIPLLASLLPAWAIQSWAIVQFIAGTGVAGWGVQARRRWRAIGAAV